MTWPDVRFPRAEVIASALLLFLGGACELGGSGGPGGDGDPSGWIREGPARDALTELACPGNVLDVPGTYPTVAAAMGAAQSGDVILVAPGTYDAFVFDKDNVTVTSRFCQSKDFADVRATILTGDLLARAPVSERSRLIGFDIRGLADPVNVVEGGLQILYNRITGGSDLVSSGNWGRTHVVVRGNYFEGAGDDAVDLDDVSSGIIEGNTILDCGQDGIEGRLFPYTGPVIEVIIRDNLILGSGQNGIQLIGGYQDGSPRSYRIERNVIQALRAGIGLMDETITHEDYRGANLTEEIVVLNNTFVDCNYGISGGDNMLVANNLFVGSKAYAVSRVDGSSLVTQNLFFQNAQDHQQSNVNPDTNRFGMDPQLGPEHTLEAGSPAIDAGLGTVTWGAKAVSVTPGFHAGAAPDLGAKEGR